jgi:hypothetical protein
MPRYFFHTEDGARLPDTEGSELPDDRTARNEAVAVLGQMMTEDPAGFWAHGTFRLIVTDAAGQTLCGLELNATVPPTVGGPAPR